MLKAGRPAIFPTSESRWTILVSQTAKWSHRGWPLRGRAECSLTLAPRAVILERWVNTIICIPQWLRSAARAGVHTTGTCICADGAAVDPCVRLESHKKKIFFHKRKPFRNYLTKRNRDTWHFSKLKGNGSLVVRRRIGRASCGMERINRIGRVER